jgi:hypothetical protein
MKRSARIRRHQRIRTLALSAGMVLGMVAATFGPQLAHATQTKASKAVIKNASAEKPVVLAAADEAQMQVADRVLLGRYECEFGRSIVVSRSEANPGYMSLSLERKSWVMKPVQSATGAIRLEDVRGQALLLQILTKSMVLDTKTGKRLVDACVHDVQRKAEADLATQPARASIFDAR